jgi:hypothetical protein
MEEEQKVNTLSKSKSKNGENTTSGINLLKKSKYTFFTVLSYCCSRTEGRMLMQKLCKRGQTLCNDKDLEILVPLTFTYEIRHPSQIRFLERFTEQT